MRLISDDALLLATGWQEARNQGRDGMVAVFEVILLRQRLRIQSDGTVAGTVCWPLAFSGWNAQDPNRIPSLKLDDSDPVVQELAEALEAAQSGKTNVSHGADHFCRVDWIDRTVWADRSKIVAVVKDVAFFRLRAA